MRSLPVECPENLDLGLFTEQACYILSVQILVSEMSEKRHPRGTAGPAVSISPKKLARTLILIVVFGFAGQGCHSQQSSAGPSIEFTHIPPAAQGGRERVDTISGRVKNARPKQQIVIYRTADHGGCSPGRLTSDRDGDQWCRVRT